ncbi:MAG: DUF1232 domain-containing protein [Nitrospirae bacterium]|nr:DUF1232 domain-containing protein [Nitrospirota bacterium]
MATPNYSEKGFWRKARKHALAAGCKVLCVALKLYYALKNPDTPAWAKATIIGALAYFISPMDAIPDMLPAVGYADDLGVLTAALATVAQYIDDSVVEKARAQMKELLGEVCKC